MGARTQRVGLAVVVVSVLVCLAVGCSSYRATISVGPTDDSTEGVVLSDADRLRAEMALSQVAQELGLVVSPELEDVARASRDDPNKQKEVMALFVTPARDADYLEVVSAVDKGTGQYSVAVVQYGSPWPTEEAKEVEAAVLKAIRQELGSHRVEISRRKGRPSLSP